MQTSSKSKTHREDEPETMRKTVIVLCLLFSHYLHLRSWMFIPYSVVRCRAVSSIETFSTRQMAHNFKLLSTCFFFRIYSQQCIHNFIAFFFHLMLLCVAWLWLSERRLDTWQREKQRAHTHFFYVTVALYNIRILYKYNTTTTCVCPSIDRNGIVRVIETLRLTS